MHTQQASINKHPVRSLLFLTNPTMILLGALLLLFSWRVPTNVRIEALAASSEDLRSQPAADLILKLQNQSLMLLEGQVSYRDFPDRIAVNFTAPARFEFSGESVQMINIERLSSQKWQIRLDGVVSSASIVSSDKARDLRLTQFDRLKNSPALLWTGGGLWLLATILGWIRVFQALNA